MTLHSLPRAATAAAALAAATATTSAAAAATPPGSVILDQPNGFSDPFKGLAGHSWVTPGRSVSANGRYVVFFTQSDGLSAAAGDDLENVYRKDRVTGVVELVSVSSNGAPANDGSDDAEISDDGNRITFATDATNLHPAATDGKHHVYVRDFALGKTMLASRACRSGRHRARGHRAGDQRRRQGRRVRHDRNARGRRQRLPRHLRAAAGDRRDRARQPLDRPQRRHRPGRLGRAHGRRQGRQHRVQLQRAPPRPGLQRAPGRLPPHAEPTRRLPVHGPDQRPRGRRLRR